MTYDLRDYQADAAHAGVSFLNDPKPEHGVIVAPQGAGKSLIIAKIVADLGRPVLVFQPTREILEQNATKLHAFGFTPAVYSAAVGSRQVGQITLATIGSVKEHPEMFEGVRDIIVDEAHLVDPKGYGDPDAKKGMYAAFIERMDAAQFEAVKVLGLTATPYRLSTDGYGGAMLKFLTRTRPRVFSKLVHMTQIGDLMARGYLVTPTYQIVTGFARDQMQPNKDHSDYTDESVKRYFNRIGFAERLHRVVLRALAVGRKNVLVFTRFVEEAEALVHTVPGTAVVSADTSPKMRKAIVDAFKGGEIQTVANVNCLSTGFDYPELDTIVLARPTMSLSLYAQQVGRVVRPSPSKQNAWVIDMVDQVGTFGKIETLRIVPGGKKGESWEVTNGRRVLTNTYFGGHRGSKPEPSWKRGVA